MSSFFSYVSWMLVILVTEGPIAFLLSPIAYLAFAGFSFMLVRFVAARTQREIPSAVFGFALLPALAWGSVALHFLAVQATRGPLWDVVTVPLAPHVFAAAILAVAPCLSAAYALVTRRDLYWSTALLYFVAAAHMLHVYIVIERIRAVAE